MPHRLLQLDYSMIFLNATSVTTLTLAWFSENLTSAGGFFVMLSVATLNFTKAYLNYKQSKNKNKNK